MRAGVIPDRMLHRAMSDLEAGLDEIRRSPADSGTLRMIVRRPREDEREVLEEGVLDPVHGLAGDNWSTRGSNRTADGSSHPDMQLNIMNARVADLVATTPERWPLAGDQLYVDFDLSEANVPAGTRLAIGEAVVEVTDQPHAGCRKFAARFGVDALKFVNSPEGKRLHLRGVNAKVVVAGVIRTGDPVRRLPDGREAG